MVDVFALVSVHTFFFSSRVLGTIRGRRRSAFCMMDNRSYDSSDDGDWEKEKAAKENRLQNLTEI